MVQEERKRHLKLSETSEEQSNETMKRINTKKKNAAAPFSKGAAVI